MSPGQSERVTRLLGELSLGRRQAADELLPLVYAELRALAAQAMQRSPAAHTLQPTALVHEAFVRLVGNEPGFVDRQHFLAVASRAMRSVLIDHARRKGALRRGGFAQRMALTESIAGYEERGLDVLALEDSLLALERLDPSLARVVELLYFAGLTAQEASAVLHCSARTVERSWRTARAFLRASLDGPGPPC